MRPGSKLLFVLLIYLVNTVSYAKDTWKGVSRIVAIGDLHGDYQQYRNVMTMTNLLDSNGKWIAGKTHLVQTGDIPDRGPDSLKIIRELQVLQKAARKSGGFIHLLIGNHEAMNIYGDLRYVHPGEYRALTDSKSAARQLDYYQRFITYMNSNGSDTVIDETFKTQWLNTYPSGYVEHRQLWQPGGEMAKWVRKHNTLIKINDILFIHGGISPHQPFVSIKEINKTVSRELGKTPLPEGAMTDSESGPLWYRGIARNPQDSELPALIKMLEYYKSEHIVMGHTTTRGVIFPRFDARAISIDVGLSVHYGGGLAALLVEDGQFYAIHRGTKIPIPVSDEGLIGYFKKIRPLEPNPIPVDKIMKLLESKPQPLETEKAQSTQE